MSRNTGEHWSTSKRTLGVTLHFGPTDSGEYVAVRQVRGNILFCYLEKRRDVGKEAGESEGTSLSMAFNHRSVWIISRRTLKDIHVRPSILIGSVRHWYNC